MEHLFGLLDDASPEGSERVEQVVVGDFRVTGLEHVGDAEVVEREFAQAASLEVEIRALCATSGWAQDGRVR